MKNKKMSLSGLSQYVVLAGLIGTLLFIYVSYEQQGAAEFLKHFLSTENMGIRFRALILFTPLITIAIAYLVNEREKYLYKVMVSEEELKQKNAELQAFNERLSALRSIDMAISTSIDLQATLKILIEKVLSQLKVDAVDLLLLSPDTNMLVYSAGSGFKGEQAERASIRVGTGLAGKVAKEKKVIKIPDLDEYIDSGKADYNVKSSHLIQTEGFKAYFAYPLIANNKFLGVIEILNRSVLNPSDEWFSFLETFAVQAAIAIDKASLFSELKESNIELVKAYDSTIEGWARALDYRDKETEGHSRRVTELTGTIAKEMGIGGDELLHIKRGALLHDIGKMGVPDRILLKQGSFTPEERANIERHPDIAHHLLAPITFLRPTIDIPYCHHEKWDGSGYPRGLKGKDIPLAARIFAIVDVWDALRSDRPYRKAWSEAETLKHVNGLSGTHFDPKIADIFIAYISTHASEIPTQNIQSANGHTEIAP
jgi:HD-GYP domain-containing protein (c-di-GMP phosphodiesterase class II)